jgi:predicted Rossmann-fold nucleotide-binding protein
VQLLISHFFPPYFSYQTKSATRAHFDPFSGSNQPGEFETLEEFEQFVEEKYHGISGLTDMEGFIFQEVDFSQVSYFSSLPLQGASFWACKFPNNLTSNDIRQMGARYVTSNPPTVPFKPLRAFLYNQDEMALVDQQIYHYTLEKDSNSFPSQLAMSVHDFSIMDALLDYAEGKSFVAICGGHALLRGSVAYLRVMELGNRIANAGFIALSGGGPGAMEACNLGAYIAGLQHHHPRSPGGEMAALVTANDNQVTEVDDVKNIIPLSEIVPEFPCPCSTREACNHTDLHRAWQILSEHPGLEGRPEFENISAAQAVIEEFGPTRCYTPSLGIPTWRYGHEPPNLFTAYHAKFFQNSVREAVLLDICYGGLIMTPGGPGTMQEVFQAACRCAYAPVGYEYPIIFYGVEYWKESGVWDIIQRQAKGRKYFDYLLLSDSVDEIMTHLVTCAQEKGLALIQDFNELDNPYWYSKQEEANRLSVASQNSLS